MGIQILGEKLAVMEDLAPEVAVELAIPGMAIMDMVLEEVEACQVFSRVQLLMEMK